MQGAKLSAIGQGDWIAEGAGPAFVTHRGAGSVPDLTFGAAIKLNKRLSFAGAAMPDMFAAHFSKSFASLHDQEKGRSFRSEMRCLQRYRFSARDKASTAGSQNLPAALYRLRRQGAHQHSGSQERETP